MFKIQDVLIPGRFFCFILQLLLTISVGFGWKDFVLAAEDNNTSEYDIKVEFFVCLSIFWLC